MNTQGRRMLGARANEERRRQPHIQVLSKKRKGKEKSKTTEDHHTFTYARQRLPYIHAQVSHADSITRYATAINSRCNQNPHSLPIYHCALSHVQHSASTGSRVHQKPTNTILQLIYSDRTSKGGRPQLSTLQSCAGIQNGCRLVLYTLLYRTFL